MKKSKEGEYKCAPRDARGVSSLMGTCVFSLNQAHTTSLFFITLYSHLFLRYIPCIFPLSHMVISP